MKRKHDDIDEMIRQALSKEDARFYEELEEESLPEMWLGLYKGKMKWIRIYATFIQIALTICMFYCVYNFLNVDSTKEMILWGVGGLLLVHMVSMLKLYHWMQMDKNSIIREIKRIELQMSMRKRDTELQ